MIRAAILLSVFAAPAYAATAPMPAPESVVWYEGLGFRPIEDCKRAWPDSDVRVRHPGVDRYIVVCDDDAYAKLGKGAHLAAAIDATPTVEAPRLAVYDTPAALIKPAITSTPQMVGGWSWGGCNCTTPPRPVPPVTPSPVPLPAAVWLLLAGLGAIFAMRIKT